VPDIGRGSPALRITGVCPRRNEGLPGSWAVLFARAVVEDPVGCNPLLAPVVRSDFFDNENILVVAV